MRKSDQIIDKTCDKDKIQKIPLCTTICKLYLILEIHVMSLYETMNIQEFIPSQNQIEIVIFHTIKSKLNYK